MLTCPLQEQEELMALEWAAVPVPATWNSTDGTGDSDDVDGCYEDSSGWPQEEEEEEEAVLPLLVLLLSLLVMSAHVHHHHRSLRRRMLTTDSLVTTTTKVTSL